MKVKSEVMFRGIRSWSKDGNEERLLLFLNTLGPLLLGPLKWPLPTIHLEGKPEYNHISSTLIRDLCKRSEKNVVAGLKELVPDEIVDAVADVYCKNK